MDHRIVEIIMYVIGEIHSRRVSLDKIGGISDDLLRRGFSQREVARAFSVFTYRMTLDYEPVEIREPLGEFAHRVLHEIERQYIGTEVHGYLLQLLHMGVLSHADLEELLERCMMSSNTAGDGEEEVKMLVATYLCERDMLNIDNLIAPVNSRPAPEFVH
ncbi:DUF494 domain-containing protein [bacterium]|nr:DUF494 domain-containing protein [bacterium]